MPKVTHQANGRWSRFLAHTPSGTDDARRLREEALEKTVIKTVKNLPLQSYL